MRKASTAITENGRVKAMFHTTFLRGLVIIASIALLAACGQVTTAPTYDVNEVDDVKPEPEAEPAWEWSPIGYLDDTVTTAAVGDAFQVRGSGSDIWDRKDEFFYVYTNLIGDGSLSVRVKDFEAENPWAKAGVMLRESLDPDARNVLLHISSQNGSVLQMRPEKGGATINDAGHDPTMAVGGWVRLTRTGDTVVGELSRDGEVWAELGRYETQLGENVLIGFAVTAHDQGTVATAEFTDVARDQRTNDQLGPLPTPEVPTPEAPVSDPTPQPPVEDPATPTPPVTEPVTPPAPPTVKDSNYQLPPATLYVATNGSDSNSGRSASAPLRTVTKAAAMVQAGDVVYLRGGVYPINIAFKTSGTASRPIVWASYPGEVAIFDGAAQSRGSSQHRVWVDGVSFNHFVNFEVRNSPQQGIFVRNAHDNLFHGLVTHGNNGSGIQNYSGNRNRYEYLVTYDNFDTVTTNGKIGEDADGIGISSGDSNVISRVISYYNSDDGIDAWRSTNTLIEHSVAFDNGRGANGNGNGFKLGGASESNQTVARFNIAFDNKASGFSQNTGRNITLYNNTSYGNAGPNFDIGSSVTARNNVSMSGRNNVLSGASSSNNSWDLGIADVRMLSSDRASTNFLSLRSDSPAIAAGRDVGLPYQGAAPDLGALAYRLTIADLLDSEQLPITEIVRAALDSATLARAQ